MGVRRIILVAAVLVAALCIGAGLSPWLSTSANVAMGFLLGVEFLLAAQAVGSFSLFMSLSSVAVAGTQFTLYMAAINLTRSQSAKIGPLLDGLGYG